MDQKISIEDNELRVDDEVIAHCWTPEQFLEKFLDRDVVSSEMRSGSIYTAEELLDIIDQAIEESNE